MTYQLYAVLVVIIALSVITINVIMLAVASADVKIWSCDRQRIAQRRTYILSAIIAAFAFAVLEFAG